MRKEVAELLSKNAGTVRDDYTGRAMFGKITHAVVYESRADYEAALLDAAFVVGSGKDPEYLNTSILNDLKNLTTDSMALGIVVY